MSITLTITGTSSILTAEYFPPIDLYTNYVCGLVDFQTYNSIPNVDETNNRFHIGNRTIEIPIGSYEIDDIGNYLKTELNKVSGGKSKVEIKSNNNTLKSSIKGSEIINFNESNSIGSLLGFSQRSLTPNINHNSDLPVNIIKVNAIRIECNIISGSYINSLRTSTLHEFSPMVGPGMLVFFFFLFLLKRLFLFI